MKALTVLIVLIATSASAELRQYGAAAPLYLPLLEPDGKNYATNVTCAAGDVKISKNGAAPVNAACFVPVANKPGVYSIALTAADHEAANIVVIVKDTDPKAWLDESRTLETYGDPNARHPWIIQLSELPPPITPPPSTGVPSLPAEHGIYNGIVTTTAFTPTVTQFQATVRDSTKTAVTTSTGLPIDMAFERVLLWVTGQLAGETFVLQQVNPGNMRVAFTVTMPMRVPPKNGDQFVVW